jgi:hypothetical protein
MLTPSVRMDLSSHCGLDSIHIHVDISIQHRRHFLFSTCALFPVQIRKPNKKKEQLRLRMQLSTSLSILAAAMRPHHRTVPPLPFLGVAQHLAPPKHPRPAEDGRPTWTDAGTNT